MRSQPGPNVRNQASRLAAVLIAMAVAAAPLAAETFLITLKNGSTIESRYQPQEASWDSGMVLFMTETGNWVGLPKSDLASVAAEGNDRGFGFVINPTTIALGWSPNDAKEPDANDQGQLGARLLEALTGGNQAPPPNYTISQGVDTSQTQGIPLSFIPGAPALGGGEVPGSAGPGSGSAGLDVVRPSEVPQP
ncbi:MAG TPA: hypothetical protein VN783_12740 [Thermoanaerobaculia bacterium]|nr:hypothetical protein [Thermoanaerobaculia bacterium]